MIIITLDALSKAIAYKIGIHINEARRVAGFVLDIFGFEDRVIDNVLGFEERQLFYILEAVGMLTSGREDTTLFDGKEWRTHYWLLKKNVILRYAKKEYGKDTNGCLTKSQPTDGSKGDVYSMLSEDVWITRKINRKKPVSS